MLPYKTLANATMLMDSLSLLDSDSQQDLKGSMSTRVFFCHAETPCSVNQDTLN